MFSTTTLTPFSEVPGVPVISRYSFWSMLLTTLSGSRRRISLNCSAGGLPPCRQLASALLAQLLSHCTSQQLLLNAHTMLQQPPLSQPGVACATKQLPLPGSPHEEHSGLTALGVSLLFEPAPSGSKKPTFQLPCGLQR